MSAFFNEIIAFKDKNGLKTKFVVFQWKSKIFWTQQLRLAFPVAHSTIYDEDAKITILF